MDREQLPTKLFGWLRMSVREVMKCEADTERFVLNMRFWHQPHRELPGVCVVCMGGAVMAGPLKVPHGESVEPHQLESEELMNAMGAIDDMRTGDFEDAFDNLGGETESLAKDEYRVLEECSALVGEHYDMQVGHAPWHVYLQCADMLEAAGL